MPTAGFWFTEVFAAHAKNEENRERLKSFHSSIEIGDSHIDVLTKIWHPADHDLRIRVDSPELWSITMPSEFLATHWGMILRFADARLIEVETRNADGHFPPVLPQPKANTKDRFGAVAPKLTGCWTGPG